MHPILAYAIFLLTVWLLWMLAIGSWVVAVPFVLLLTLSTVWALNVIEYRARLARDRRVAHHAAQARLDLLHETRKDHQ